MSLTLGPASCPAPSRTRAEAKPAAALVALVARRYHGTRCIEAAGGWGRGGAPNSSMELTDKASNELKQAVL